MRAFQTCGCLSAVVRTVLITECLLMGVRGDGADSEEKLETKYAWIGAGIGLFLAAGFIIIKVYIIRKHVYENTTDDCMRRPREPHLLTLSHLSQSENPVAAEFPDMQC
ncbi:transmembrane protein 273-like isoform X2 [Trachinotus anak]|uniref:transmembrane protein 273-like isoform X2 n=1 Tax=Trachinotus anak TaxID=443729 RepID=UPI0039F1AE17